MRTDLRWFLTSLAVFGVAGGAAWAAHHEGGEGKDKERHKRYRAMLFEKADADGNGEISREEWMASAEARFSRADADESGAVTKEEMKAAREKRREEWKKKKKREEEQGS